MTSFSIERFESQYSHQVRDLVKDTFEEFGFGFDLSNNDKDLIDIRKSYFIEHGKFWVLLENEKIIGTIALKPFRNVCYELKRFFIYATHRGKGYGNKALEFVITYVKAKKIETIKLVANSKLHNAIHLYEKYGFHEIVPYKKSNIKDLKWFEINL